MNYAISQKLIYDTKKEGDKMPKMSLAALRKNVKLTQEQAAKKLGIAVSTLKSWEAGKTFPKQDAIEKICELYGVSYDYIDFSARS